MALFGRNWIDENHTSNEEYHTNMSKDLIQKPKWIPGPPTTTGWHWLKFNDNSKLIYECNAEIPIRHFHKCVDGMIIKGGLIITHHCPIQEPEE